MSDESSDPQEPSPKELRREAKAALKSAERGLKDAEKAHKQALTAAEQGVAKAEEGVALAACAPYTLFADRVYTPEGTVWLEPSMHAEVDTSGNLQVDHRPTATRACACGCLPALVLQKKETHDTRRLFISITGPGIASVGEVAPAMEATARQFVAAFNAAVSNGPVARAEREKAVEEAQAQLDAVRADREAIERAEVERDAARARLSELES